MDSDIIKESDGFRYIQFNIMLIIFKKWNLENASTGSAKNAKKGGFGQFFACRNQNDEYICNPIFYGR